MTFFLFLAILRRNDEDQGGSFGGRVDYAILVKRQFSTRGVTIERPISEKEVQEDGRVEGGTYKDAVKLDSFSLMPFDTIARIDLVCLLLLGEIADRRGFFAHVGKLMKSLYNGEEIKEIVISDRTQPKMSPEDVTAAIRTLQEAQERSLAKRRPVMAPNSVLDNQTIAERTSRLGTIYLDLDDKVKEKAAKKAGKSKEETQRPSQKQRTRPAIPPGKCLPVPTYDLTHEEDVTLVKPSLKELVRERIFGAADLRRLIKTVIKELAHQ